MDPDMKAFCEHIQDKVCVDFEQDEITDIKEALIALLEKLTQSLLKVNKVLEVQTLVPCGSMAEMTRNWKFAGKSREPIIEFDFLAIVNNLQHDQIQTRHLCDGFMQIIDENQCLKRYCCRSNALGAERISFAFQLDLMKSINYLCNCFKFDDKTQFLQKDDCCKFFLFGTVEQMNSGCRHCTERKKSGYLQIATGTEIGSPYYHHCSVVFRWTSTAESLRAPDLVHFKEKGPLKGLYILTDFLPAFEILKNKINNDVNTEILSPNSCPYDLFGVESPKVSSEPSPKLSNEPSLKLSSDAFPKLSSDASPKLSSDAPPNISSDVSPKVFIAASRKVFSHASPKIFSHASPKVFSDVSQSDASPYFFSDASPKVSSDASPKVFSDASPNVSSDTSPKASSDASPKVFSDASPKVFSDASPNFFSDASPKPSSDASPNIFNDASPNVVCDASPKVLSDASPNFFCDAFPNFLSDESTKVSSDAPPKVFSDASPKVFSNVSPKAFHGVAKVSSLQHHYYLVPKTCYKNHETCWKISNCAVEITSLKKTSIEHRQVYMILKFITDCLFSGFIEDDSFPSTYKVKTAVLHHIKSCRSITTYNKHFDCVMQILADLSYSFSNQHLDNFVNGLNSLRAKGVESMPDQMQAWHRNRCKIVGHCYNFVFNLFENFNDILDEQHKDMSFQSGINMLKYVGRAFNEAWKETEVEIIYGVDENKLKDKLKQQFEKSGSFYSQDGNCEAITCIFKQECPKIHWTKYLKVWEYESVRKMHGRHHYACPDPPGGSQGKDEKILQKAKKFCGFFQWEPEHQKKWIEKLETSDNPYDITTALKSVGIYYIEVEKNKLEKAGRLAKGIGDVP